MTARTPEEIASGLIDALQDYVEVGDYEACVAEGVAAIKEAVEAEREACAQVASKIGGEIMEQAQIQHDEGMYDSYEELERQAVVASEIESAIRARSDPAREGG